MKQILGLVMTLGATLLMGAAPALGSARQSRMYSPGWNLVSGPEGSHLFGAVGSLYTLRPGDTAYEVIPNGAALERCVGYWAYFGANGGGLQTSGFGGGSCSLSLDRGEWALLGNPGITLGPVTGGVQTLSYDSNGYHVATAVDPGGAVWVLGPGVVQETPPPHG